MAHRRMSGSGLVWVGSTDQFKVGDTGY